MRDTAPVPLSRDPLGGLEDKMDRSEQVAMKHLLFCGFSTVVYEPDGNVPPDFLVDGSIAVEVRR